MGYDAPADVPFDSKSPSLQPEDWSLERVLKQAGLAWAHSLRVCLPARIVSVNGPQNVDLQPLLKTRSFDNKVEQLPVIRSALVAMPFGADWYMKYPLAEGDSGLAVFCDRSIDTWAIGQGDAADPQDDRCHELSDAFFIPGIATIPKQLGDKTTDMVLRNGKTTMRIQKNGRVSFGNGQNELVDMVGQLIKQLQNLTDELTASIVLTAFGPAQFAATTLAKLAKVKADTAAVGVKVDTLKGDS